MRLLTFLLLTAGAGAVMLGRRGRALQRPDAMVGGSSDDRDDYAPEAARSGLLIRELAELAARRAADPRVAAYAEMLAEDHSEAADRLSLARSGDGPGWAAPAALDAGRREALDDLTTAADQDFDALFLDRVVRLHEADLALHEAYVDEAEDEALAEHAVGMIALHRRHLETGRRLRAELESEGPTAAPAEPTLSQAGGA